MSGYISMDEWAAAMEGQSQTLAALGEEFKNDLRRQGVYTEICESQGDKPPMSQEEVNALLGRSEDSLTMDDWAAAIQTEYAPPCPSESIDEIVETLDAIPTSRESPILSLDEIKACVNRANERWANPITRLENDIERHRELMNRAKDSMEFHRGYIQGLQDGLRCLREFSKNRA